MTISVFAFQANTGRIQLTVLLPAPAHRPQVKAARRPVANRAVFAVLQAAVSIAAFITGSIVTNMAKRHRHPQTRLKSKAQHGIIAHFSRPGVLNLVLLPEQFPNKLTLADKKGAVTAYCHHSQ
jgi:hypothetical protein